ncbi:hypothetical protein HHI36_003814 [Cryptolaemus montrouzieri]|uniref:HotDog ACOT-type domain-containing protein n=1 Tax=Cryptolaemus montrouzieri TaxID=559131 RepID=A0ABD2NPA1_9CUCU
MKDSFLEGIIPLSIDVNLQEKYITFLGHVRIGRLLEDMDIFAVHIGYKYIHTPTVPANIPSPYMLVTAFCAQIDFTRNQRKYNEDIKLSGFVSWVGRSSMEIVVWLEQHHQGSWKKITRALFLLAARNAIGKQAAAVNPLVPLNDYEKKIFQEAEVRKTERSKYTVERTSDVVPTNEEQLLIHDLYLTVKDIDLGKMDEKIVAHGVIPMEKCKLSNVIFCQPEDRNYYNTVFGGFIMRHATELAWVLGYKFCRHRPFIAHISDIGFHSPVAVNALVHMHAQIVFTEESFMQIIVSVISFDPVEGTETKSNTFHLTLKSPEPVKRICPKTYHEAMLLLNGRRHFYSVLAKNSAEKNDIMDEYMLQLSKTR